MHKCLQISTIALTLTVVSPGCRSPRMPTPVNHPSYQRAALHDVLQDLVVRLNIHDCPEEVFRYQAWYFATATETPHNLHDILADEFLRAIADNFTPVNQVRARLAKVELNVTINRIDLYDPYFGDARCAYTFTMRLVDPRSNDVKPFFEKTIAVERHSPIEDGKIPYCVYAAVQHVVSEFMNCVAADKEVIRLLEDRNQEIPPEISDWQPRHLNGSAIRGNAYVSCNDWNMDAARTWAKKQIFKRAASEMRLSEQNDEVRVFYFRESYEETTGRWNFEFDAIPAEPLVIIPRSESNWRTGRCYIDVKLIKAKEGNQALAVAKRQILERARAEGIEGMSVELKKPKRHEVYPEVIVAEYNVK